VPCHLIQHAPIPCTRLCACKAAALALQWSVALHGAAVAAAPVAAVVPVLEVQRSVAIGLLSAGGTWHCSGWWLSGSMYLCTGGPIQPSLPLPLPPQPPRTSTAAAAQPPSPARMLAAAEALSGASAVRQRAGSAVKQQHYGRNPNNEGTVHAGPQSGCALCCS
jgi:hypothetical protein